MGFRFLLERRRKLSHLELFPFPQPSTKRNPNPVTNNLYREFRKAQACYVRKFSTTGSSSNPEAKSLFQKIVAVSPYASIFCRPREIPASASRLQSGFYPLTMKKILWVYISRRAVAHGAPPLEAEHELLSTITVNPQPLHNCTYTLARRVFRAEHSGKLWCCARKSFRLPISPTGWDNRSMCENRSTLCFLYWPPGRCYWAMPWRSRLRQHRRLNPLNPHPLPRRRPPPQPRRLP